MFEKQQKSRGGNWIDIMETSELEGKKEETLGHTITSSIPFEDNKANDLIKQLPVVDWRTTLGRHGQTERPVANEKVRGAISCAPYDFHILRPFYWKSTRLEQPKFYPDVSRIAGQRMPANKSST
ncbi:hypothetical protein OUZ56_031899 [Daphnia magna]|uniref:Uncharacterized protein n=1 Tax=Daphnia magna TaxID=35525 RepID=A0ABQ9ZVJ7_9CRUS|nr:hypothetical protein OUZ56_031899 [Daphnia magna]